MSKCLGFVEVWSDLDNRILCSHFDLASGGGPEPPGDGEEDGGQKHAQEVSRSVLGGGAGRMPEPDLVPGLLASPGDKGRDGAEGDAPPAEEGVAAPASEGGDEDGDGEAGEEVLELVGGQPVVAVVLHRCRCRPFGLSRKGRLEPVLTESGFVRTMPCFGPIEADRTKLTLGPRVTSL